MRTRWAGTVAATAAVSLGHMVSHIYILLVPALFPHLTKLFGIGYLELGLAVTLFGAVTTISQTPAGFLVDRVGAPPVLAGGLLLGGLVLLMLSWRLTYDHLIWAAAMLGLANSVYHPAGYAILSSQVNGKIIGRAFSVHLFAGYTGNAVTPVLAIFLSRSFGVEAVFFCAALLGLASAAIVILALRRQQGVAGRDGRQATPGTGLSLPPMIWMIAGFFLLLSLANSAISNFSLPALTDGYGFDLVDATTALTAYLGASAFGVLAGGVLADKTTRHARVTAACFFLSALLVMTIALVTPGVAVLVLLMGTAGFLSGFISPSRDLLVRNLAPAGTTGRAFGLATTGFSVVAIAGPVLFGTMLDSGFQRGVFAASAAASVLALIVALYVDRRG